MTKPAINVNMNEIGNVCQLPWWSTETTPRISTSCANSIVASRKPRYFPSEPRVLYADCKLDFRSWWWGQTTKRNSDPRHCHGDRLQQCCTCCTMCLLLLQRLYCCNCYMQVVVVSLVLFANFFGKIDTPISQPFCMNATSCSGQCHLPVRTIYDPRFLSKSPEERAG